MIRGGVRDIRRGRIGHDRYPSGNGIARLGPRLVGAVLTIDKTGTAAGRERATTRARKLLLLQF